MYILGLNAYHGDASAALLRDGELVAALEEERLNRIKHWAGLPVEAARCVLNGEAPEHVAISRNPRAHFGSKLLRLITHPANWRKVQDRAANSLRVLRLADDVRSTGITGNGKAHIHFVEHHRAHLASAFFASPFEEAAVISIDGFGDFSSFMWATGRGNRMKYGGSVQFPHSLGLYYTAFTQFLGFPKYGDEYKMMGLAAYGEPRFAQQVRDVVRTRNGSVTLNLDYFTHNTTGAEMTWAGGEPTLSDVFSPKMIEVFGERRNPRSEILQGHMDLAASVQLVLEENYFALLRWVHQQTKQKAVCLAGGVALNCVANGKIFEQTPFQDVYIQPAAHDAGTSIGAALYTWHETLGKPRQFTMRHVYYGPECSETEIRKELESTGVTYEKLDNRTLVNRTAQALAAGNIVGWFQGRAEFGPRALGNRSILADPRDRSMKDTLNRRIKYREPFRPFCPSILAESTADYFETSYPSPFMIVAYRIKPGQQERIPAVTHEDGTGRLQTVEKEVNPLYWQLIRQFGDLTGVPVLLNTSFNENEPIVNTPAQAIDCFLRTKMDALVIGPYYLLKSENPAAETLEVAQISR